MTDRAVRYIKLVLLVLGFSTLARIYFLLINVSLFKSFPLKDTLYALVGGVLSDLPVILALNIIFAAIYFLPKTAIFQNKKPSKIFLSTLFWVTNVPIIFVSLFNAEYYKLAGERIVVINYSSMAKMGEFQSIFSHLLPRLMLILLLALLFVLITKKYFYSQKEVYLTGLRQLFYFVAFVGGALLSLKSIVQSGEIQKPVSTVIESGLSLTHLKSNSLITIIKKNIN